MNQFSFDLRTEGWIDVIYTDGRRMQLGLSDALIQAHKIKAILPIVSVDLASQYRVLLAIMQRAFPIESGEDWKQLWDRGFFDPDLVHGYLDGPTCRDRFDLFHPERPFYQVTDARVQPKSLLKLVPHLSSGNNPTLFDHSLESRGVRLSPAEAARYLVAIQNYGLGGLSGIEEKFTAALPSRGISFFVIGENLFQTLLLNHIPPDATDLNGIPRRVPAQDVPCWEMDDPYSKRNHPYGLCDYLTWQNRRVLLFPEEENGKVIVRTMTEAPGLRIDDKYIDGVNIRDPYQFYRQGSLGPTVLRFSEDRAVWRDSSALFRFSREEELKAPSNLLWLNTLSDPFHRYLPEQATYNISALGFAADKAKILFYGSETLSLPAAFLEDPQIIQNLRIALDKAEALSKSLFFATTALAETFIKFDADRLDDSSKRPKKEVIEPVRGHLLSERIFWSRLGQDFHELVHYLPSDPEQGLDNWYGHLEKHLLAALDHTLAMAGDDVRALKGGVKARNIVHGAIKKHLHN